MSRKEIITPSLIEFVDKALEAGREGYVQDPSHMATMFYNQYNCVFVKPEVDSVQSDKPRMGRPPSKKQ